MSKKNILMAKEICSLHDNYLSFPHWPDGFKLLHHESNSAYEFIEANHFFNTKLWNEEDLARRQKVSDTEIAKNKRAIDGFNQSRNDCIEKIDSFILTNIKDLDKMHGKQNSETLGGMIDRLSILSLKIFHMALQAQRKNVSENHTQICNEKLEVLKMQRIDLAVCFDELMADCIHGIRHFKQYRQYKMYNDPNLNPQIYNAK